MRDKDTKPQPVVKVQVCSVCGQKWENHGDAEEITLLDCIDALQRALATRPPVPTFNTSTHFVPVENTA